MMSPSLDSATDPAIDSATTPTIFTADRAVIGRQARGPTSVLTNGGSIVAVGDPETVAKHPLSTNAKQRNFPDRVLLPGTVNTHNHSFQSLLRGIGDDLPFLEWRDRALYRYSPGLDADAMTTAATFAFGEMLLHGVTTVCDFYYVNRSGNDNASATIEAARKLGIRIVLARCFYDWDGAPEAYRETVPDAVANFEALFESYGRDPRWLTNVQPAPHSQHGASPAMIEAGAGCAKDHDCPWHIHLAEEEYQVGESLDRFGLRPLHAIDSLGVLSDQTIAVHGCWFDESERALLAERGAGLAYNPASNMFLGDGITDVVDLRQRGVVVGLGTDGGCSNNRVSVFDEMRMCALLQKVAKTDGQATTAEDCLAMGTELGGRLLGLPVGCISPGFRADFVFADLADPSLWPVQGLVKNTVYSLSSRAITDVVVDGDVVVADRKLTRVDQEAIRKSVRDLTRDWQR